MFELKTKKDMKDIIKVYKNLLHWLSHMRTALNWFKIVSSGGICYVEITPWRQNQNVHHRIHNSPPASPILSQLDRLYTPSQSP
jgi:hypothetical protein